MAHLDEPHPRIRKCSLVKRAAEPPERADDIGVISLLVEMLQLGLEVRVRGVRMRVTHPVLNCQCHALGHHDFGGVERDVVVFHRDNELRFSPAEECAVVRELREVTGEHHARSNPDVESFARAFVDCHVGLGHVVTENPETDPPEVHQAHAPRKREVESHDGRAGFTRGSTS